MPWKFEFYSPQQPLIILVCGNALYLWFNFVETDRSFLSIVWQVIFWVLNLGMVYARFFPRYNSETGQLAGVTNESPQVIQHTSSEHSSTEVYKNVSDSVQIAMDSNPSQGLLALLLRIPYQILGGLINYVKFVMSYNPDAKRDSDWGVERCIDDDSYKIAFKNLSGFYMKIKHQMFSKNVISCQVYIGLFWVLSHVFNYVNFGCFLLSGFNGVLFYCMVEKIMENPTMQRNPVIQQYQNLKSKISPFLGCVNIERWTGFVNSISETQKEKQRGGFYQSQLAQKKWRIPWENFGNNNSLGYNGTL